MWTALEPMQRVWWHRILFSCQQYPLMKYGVNPFRRLSLRIVCPDALDEEMDLSPPAAERLLFTRIVLEGRMPMLRAGLAWEDRKLLRTASVRAHVREQLQAGFFEASKPEIRYFDPCLFFRGQKYASRAKHLDCAVGRFDVLVAGYQERTSFLRTWADGLSS